ncbi:hydrogenase nickel incorporation protein HypB [Magnetococcales bacterium HHB-1]
MCQDCGCDTKERLTHELSVAQNIYEANDIAAEKNRQWLKKRGVVALNLISSPGSGKTLLLEKTLEALRGQIKCSVLVGDPQTDRDAERLRNKGAQVYQIETQHSCHLNAEQIGRLLPDVVDKDCELLFIENVGNLVCPATFDLGEREKIALLSVTEGEDKPLKYPVLFHHAHTTLITKCDLIPHISWDHPFCLDGLRATNPEMQILAVSALSGEGMDHWLDFLSMLSLEALEG